MTDFICDTGKICYATPKEASTAAANLSKGDKRHKYSFYKCPLCKNFHTNTVKSAKKKMAQRKEKYPFRYVPLLKEEVPVKKKKNSIPNNLKHTIMPISQNTEFNEDAVKNALENVEKMTKKVEDFEMTKNSSSEPMVQREMPKYQSHKKVWALKIKEIVLDSDLAKEDGNRETDGSAIITPKDEGFAPFKVDASYVFKHKPQAGGYYVVYDDGYKSWSPAEAFESGYTRI